MIRSFISAFCCCISFSVFAEDAEYLFPIDSERFLHIEVPDFFDLEDFKQEEGRTVWAYVEEDPIPRVDYALLMLIEEELTLSPQRLSKKYCVTLEQKFPGSQAQLEQLFIKGTPFHQIRHHAWKGVLNLHLDAIVRSRIFFSEAEKKVYRAVMILQVNQFVWVTNPKRFDQYIDAIFDECFEIVEE